MKKLVLLIALFTAFTAVQESIAQPSQIGLGDWTYILHEGSYFLSTDGKSPTWPIDTRRILFETDPGFAIGTQDLAKTGISFARLRLRSHEQYRYSLQ